MDKEKIISLVKQYSDVVKNHLPVKKILLFGSYAKGYPNKHSDIDVAVVVDKLDGDFLSSASLLYSLREDIDFRIEPLLFEQEKDNSEFLDYILKNGIVVYQAA